MSQLRFDGRVAIVTGAGGGMGEQYALLLAERGAAVVVNDLGSSVNGDGASSEADNVARRIRELGGVAVADYHSVATPAGGEGVVATAMEAFGRIDIVINNAGILRDKAFHNLTPEMLEQVLAVHVKGAFYVTRPAWMVMRERRYGRIVNTSSNSGLLGNFGQSNYAAAKMGVVGLTRVLALEGRRYNIKANVIAPTGLTRMTAPVLESLPERDYFDPRFVAPMVAWLAHEDVPVTGEIYTAGAGRAAKFFVGMTRGYFHHDMSPEDIRDNFDQICEASDYLVPSDLSEELELILHGLRRLRSAVPDVD